LTIEMTTISSQVSNALAILIHSHWLANSHLSNGLLLFGVRFTHIVLKLYKTFCSLDYLMYQSIYMFDLL
jgi:hypothetical protein